VTQISILGNANLRAQEARTITCRWGKKQKSTVDLTVHKMDLDVESDTCLFVFCHHPSFNLRTDSNSRFRINTTHCVFNLDAAVTRLPLRRHGYLLKRLLG
jgi:hypothetical protein